MNQDTFNMEVRKFLKVVGVTSQREIEAAVERAIQAGRIKGSETLSAKVVLTIDGVHLKHEITGEIGLE
jgi:ribosomal protein L1